VHIQQVLLTLRLISVGAHQHQKIVQITAGIDSGAGSDRFHDFFDVLFRAVLDLLEFFVLAEFSKASFNHLEEFVDVTHESCEFVTDLSRVQFSSGCRAGLRLIRLFELWEGRALESSMGLLDFCGVVVCVWFDF